METSGKFESPGGPGGPLKPDREPGDNHEIEDAIASRLYYRAESFSAELMSSAETPEELFRGLRQLEKQLEDGNIPGPLTERYTPPRELAIMYERADVLGIPIDKLQRRGWIRNYDPNTGEGLPKKRRYASLALSVDEIPIVDQKTGREIGVDVKYNFGTADKRETMEKAYRRAVLELEVRAIMGDHIGARLNLEIRDSLESLTALMHSGRMPKFRADHLETLFNMPGVDELESNPENRQLGDQVEEAMFLNLVMLNSGTKQKMLDFLERPGAKHLIAKLAKEKGQNYDDWIKENIGDVNSWVDDNDRLLTDKSETEPATFRLEAMNKRRGTLTKWSNIASWGGKSGEFGANKEKEFIEDIVGDLVGSAEASWIAATMMRVIGAYASEGYVALPNGKSLLPLGEGRYVSGDDTGKFWSYMFNFKEGTKGRTSGLKDMIGRIPDMAMSLFDWAQVVVGQNPDGTEIRRSIWDAWLGTPGGKKKIDILTGKETNEITVEEPYRRLGDLNFASLERDFHGTFTIMQWLMGNGEQPTGVFIDAMKTDFRYEDFTLNQLKKMWKYIDIVMNVIVLTKGSRQLCSNLDAAPKIIKKNYLRNLMIARIHSASFTSGILGSTVKLYDPDRGHAEVPAPVLIRAFVKEVLKDDPQDEEELIRHYIDENKVLRTLGKKGTPGLSEDVSAILTEKFEPDNLKEKELMNYVGRVTGRKI